MFFRHSQLLVLGLDSDATSARAVLLCRDGERVRVVGQRSVQYRDEGILDEKEFLSHLKPWLDANGWGGCETVVGLPQPFGTVKVADLPPVEAKELDRLVAYETRHLSGLSDSTFLHGYQVLPPGNGCANPVLMAFYRESTIRECLDGLAAAGLNVADLTLESLAVVNAYVALVPDARQVALPRLLVEVGGDRTTLTIVATGDILFATSLPFSVQDWERQVRRTEAGAAAEPAVAVPERAGESLTASLLEAVAAWRQQKSPAAAVGFDRVFLCGGAVRIPGAAELCAALFACRAQNLAPPSSEPGREAIDAILTTAYGLALQGLGLAAVSISLAPDAVRWASQRRRRLPQAVFACVLVFLVVAASLGLAYTCLTEESRHLTATEQELMETARVYPQLQQLAKSVRQLEFNLLPYVEKANHSGRLLTAVQAMNRARGDQDWFIYLADGESFRAGKGNPPPAAEKPAEPPPASLAPLTGLPGPLVPRPSPDTPPPAPPPAAPVGTGNVQIAVDKIQPLTVLVAAGFSPWREGEPYKPIREIVTKLNRGELPAGKLLENVDLLSDSELVGREDIFAAWHARFAALRDEEPDDGTRDEKWRFKAFAIQLPFAVPDVNVAREGEPRK